MNELCIYDPAAQTLTLTASHHPYVIELSTLKTEADALTWLRHLVDKRWMDRESVAAFLDAVATAKGWNLRR